MYTTGAGIEVFLIKDAADLVHFPSIQYKFSKSWYIWKYISAEPFSYSFICCLM